MKIYGFLFSLLALTITVSCVKPEDKSAIEYGKEKVDSIMTNNITTEKKHENLRFPFFPACPDYNGFLR